MPIGTDFSMAFNCPVDPDEVESIEVVVANDSGMGFSLDSLFRFRAFAENVIVAF